jgi:hypothetical protein
MFTLLTSFKLLLLGGGGGDGVKAVSRGDRRLLSQLHPRIRPQYKKHKNIIRTHETQISVNTEQLVGSICMRDLTYPTEAEYKEKHGVWDPCWS